MYDQAKADAIIADIATGLPAYKAAAAQGVPDGTFWRWLTDSSALAERYARAKEKGLERMAEEILELSDEERVMTITKTYKDGTTEEREMDVVERSRLQVDSRKWLLSKLLPKKYGDKLDMNLSGGVKVVAIQDDVL